MCKHMFIVCGVSQTGKDTAVGYMEQFLERRNLGYWHMSSIQPVKSMVALMGCYEYHDQATRLMLAEIKNSLEKNDWMVTRDLIRNFSDRFKRGLNIGITQYREVDGIEAFKFIAASLMPDVKVHVIKVTRIEAENNCPDNHADKDVFNIKPDHIIHNEGSKADLKDAVENLLTRLLKQ